MRISKLNGIEKVAILVIVFIFAAVGIASYAYTSAKTQQATSSEATAYTISKVNTSSAAFPDNREETSSGETEIADDMSKAVLRVDGMSCSGCIYTIKSSLAGFNGILDILVNLSAGETEVYFNRQQLKDVDKIANAITNSGYPAKVIAVLSADQIREAQSRNAARAVNYIASVGDWDISRTDFNTELNHAMSRYTSIYGDKIFVSERGNALTDNLKVQIVSRLIDEGIQIQEIKKAGFSVDTATVDNELNTFLTQKGIDRNKLITELDKNGYGFDYYMKRFENRVLINKYLDERILDGAANDFEKQRRYGEWFKNASLLAKTVYYDKDIERLVQANAAGGGCSGGGNCSASK
ncbi:SurA N-terminal domain-containing protein [Thermodesulfobacteriota bacterium]